MTGPPVDTWIVVPPGTMRGRVVLYPESGATTYTRGTVRIGTAAEREVYTGLAELRAALAAARRTRGSA